MGNAPTPPKEKTDQPSEAEQLEASDNSVRPEDGDQPKTAEDIFWEPKEDDDED